MVTLTMNIPIKITISNDTVNSIELCNLSNLNIEYKNYLSDVKSVLNTILIDLTVSVIVSRTFLMLLFLLATRYKKWRKSIKKK